MSRTVTGKLRERGVFAPLAAGADERAYWDAWREVIASGLCRDTPEGSAERALVDSRLSVGDWTSEVGAERRRAVAGCALGCRALGACAFVVNRLDRAGSTRWFGVSVAGVAVGKRREGEPVAGPDVIAFAGVPLVVGVGVGG